jgi:hypothetical protein
LQISSHKLTDEPWKVCYRTADEHSGSQPGRTYITGVCPYMCLVDRRSVQKQNAVIDFKYFMNMNWRYTFGIKQTSSYEKYLKLLHYNHCKPRTCFGHPCGQLRWGAFLEGYTKATKPIYSYQMLNFKYTIRNICML